MQGTEPGYRQTLPQKPRPCLPLAGRGRRGSGEGLRTGLVGSGSGFRTLISPDPTSGQVRCAKGVSREADTLAPRAPHEARQKPVSRHTPRRSILPSSSKTTSRRQLVATHSSTLNLNIFAARAIPDAPCRGKDPRGFLLAIVLCTKGALSEDFYPSRPCLVHH